MFSLANCTPKEASGQVMEYAGGSGLSNGREQREKQSQPAATAATAAPGLSRYESQKRRDWNTFGQYLKNHKPPLALQRCSGAHVVEFLRYLDQFGKTKVHNTTCPFFGQPMPPAPCPCPLRQAWGSLDALVGRLRAAFEENGGQPEANAFGARAVRLYLREVREQQSKARGIAYEKKKRKLPTSTKPSSITLAASVPLLPPPSISSSASLIGLHQTQSFHHNHYQLGAPPVNGEEAAFGGSTVPLSVLN